MGRERSEIVAVDLFCGASGLSLGLMQSGIKIAAGIDLDPACRYPFEQNIGAPFLLRDISTVASDEVEALFGSAEIRLLAGCAPCQPFSGYTTRRRNIDGRWQLLMEFLRIVRGVLPDIVTLENVPRLVHPPLWETFVDGLRESGFEVAWQVLDAADFGVPQSRRRLVLLASRLRDIALPSPLKGELPTVRKAIGGLPAIGAGDRSETDLLHASRALQGGTWRVSRHPSKRELGESGQKKCACGATKARAEKPIRLFTDACHGTAPHPLSPLNFMVLEMGDLAIRFKIGQLPYARAQFFNLFR